MFSSLYILAHTEFLTNDTFLQMNIYDTAIMQEWVLSKTEQVGYFGGLFFQFTETIISRHAQMTEYISSDRSTILPPYRMNTVLCCIDVLTLIERTR